MVSMSTNSRIRNHPRFISSKKQEEFLNSKERYILYNPMEINTQERIKGKIIKINEEQGWGFCISKDIEFTRIFFHWSALRPDTLNFKELKVGMEIEFTPFKKEDDPDPKKNGWRAHQIMVLNNESNKSTVL